MAYTIDILIKIKEIGSQIIEEIDEKLKNLQKTVQATRIEDFGDIGNVFETVSGSIDNIESSVGTIENLMLAAAYRVAREVDATIERASEKFGASIVETESRAMKVIGALSGTLMAWGSATFQQISGYFKTSLTYGAAFTSSWKLLYNTVSADIRVISSFVGERLLGLFNLFTPIKASFDLLMKGAMAMGGFLSTFMLQASKIGVQLWIGQIAMLVMKDAFGQTVEFAKRVLGLSTKTQTVLGKTTAVVNYLSDGIQVINIRLTEVIKPLTYAGAVIAGMVGFLPGITMLFSVPAMLNTLLSLANRLFQRSKMYVGTIFGSARAQLNLIFAEGKDFLTKFLLNTRRVTINTKNWTLALQGAVTKGKEISAIDYFRGIYGMSTQDKITLMFFKIDAFIKNISAEIRTLTALIAHIFNIPDVKVEQLRGKAVSAIGEIDQEVMSGFVRAQKFAQNFLMLNLFRRLLKSLKPLAPAIIFPFKALYKILVSLPFAGLKKIYGLFKKPIKIVDDKGVSDVKTQEDVLKSVSAELRRIKAILRSLDFVKIVKAIEDIDSKIPVITEGTKKTVAQLRGKAVSAIGEIDQEVMSGFVRAQKFAQNFLMLNLFRRLLKSLKPLAPAIIFPFKALYKILVSLPFAGLKKIYGLFKKPIKIVDDKGVSDVKTQEDVLKSVSAELRRIKAILRSLDFVKIVKAIEDIDSKIPVITEGTKKTVAQVDKIKQGAGETVGTGPQDFFLMLNKMGSSGALVMMNLINAFQQLWLGTGKTEAVGKALGNLYEEIKKIDPASAALMEKGVMGIISGKISIKAGAAKEAFEEFGKAFYKLNVLTQEKAKTLAPDFVRTISEGIKGYSPAVEKVVSDFAKMIASFFPPGAKGALSDPQKMGEQTMEYTADGVKKGVPRFIKEVDKGVEEAAKRFPRSLPLVGPLVHLITMGFKIPFYIAQGMRKGFNLLRSTASMMATEISKHLSRAVEFSVIGERIGMSIKDVSLLDAVMGSVGGKISEANMSLSRLNAAVRDIGKAKEFAKLGIDLEALQKSANPMMTALLKISDILKYSAKNTEAYKTAIQLLATTVGSKFVVALKRGSSEIVNILAQNKAAGMYYNEEFATVSKRWFELWDRLKKIRQFSVGKLLQKFTKEFSELLDFINVYLDRYSTTIMAYMSAIGVAILGVGKAIAKVMKKVLQDPKSAFEELKKLASITIDFVSDSVPLLFKILKLKSSESLNSIFIEIKKIVVKSLADIWDYISKQWVKLGEDLLYYFYSLAKKILEKFLEIAKKIYGFFGKELRIEIIDSWGDRIRAEEIEMRKQMVITTERKKIEIAKQLSDLKKLWEGYKTTISDEKEAPVFANFLGEMDKVFDRFDKSVENVADKAQEKVKKVTTQITKDVKTAAKTMADVSAASVDTAIRGIIRYRAEYTKDIEAQRVYDYDNFVRQLDQQENLILGKIDRDRDYVLYKSTQRELELAREQALAQKKIELDKRVNQAKLQAISKTTAITGEILGNMGTMFADLYEMSGKKLRAFAIAEKAIQIGQATMRAANAVLNALYTYPPPFSFIAAGAAAAMGTVQVAKIAAVNFATGGLATGGSGTKDDIPAMLMDGEYVFNKAATGYYTKQIMDALNNRKIPRELLAGLAGIPGSVAIPNSNVSKFATGGGVGNVANNFLGNSRQNNNKEDGGTNVVVVPDPALLERYLAERAGQNAVLVVLRNHAAEVREIVSRG